MGRKEVVSGNKLTLPKLWGLGDFETSLVIRRGPAMTNSFLPSAFATFDLWYAVPLIVVVSLVYSATRHEDTAQILVQALRTGVWIVCFMAVIFLILMILAWLL